MFLASLELYYEYISRRHVATKFVIHKLFSFILSNCYDLRFTSEKLWDLIIDIYTCTDYFLMAPLWERLSLHIELLWPGPLLIKFFWLSSDIENKNCFFSVVSASTRFDQTWVSRLPSRNNSTYAMGWPLQITWCHALPMLSNCLCLELAAVSQCHLHMEHSIFIRSLWF